MEEERSRLPPNHPPEPGKPLYGCFHVGLFLRVGPRDRDGRRANFIKYYKMTLRLILQGFPPGDENVQQSIETSDVEPADPEPYNFDFDLSPSYLCLQCALPPATVEVRTYHRFHEKHNFFVESRTGCLFCGLCNDFVYDPTMEQIRMRKIATGAFVANRRKYAHLFTPMPEQRPGFIMDIDDFCTIRGLRGIYNMGATCFMSVILQTIVHNPLLRNHYLADGHDSEACKHEFCLSCMVANMFHDFFSTDLVTPYAAIDILMSSMELAQEAAFAGLVSNEEQDAHEYFQFLVENLHKTSITSIEADDEDNVITGCFKEGIAPCNCVVHRTFYGTSRSSLTCSNCNNIAASYEAFLDLSLGLEAIMKKQKSQHGNRSILEPLTLQRCLEDEYGGAEDCSFTCNNCNLCQLGLKQLNIQVLPNVLCIQFKRFAHDYVADTTTKIDARVLFPIHLDMTPYTSMMTDGRGRRLRDLTRLCTYELSSVVVHTGNKMNTGHYISYAKVGESWFRFDDAMVTLATEAQVLDSEAFLLFYVLLSATALA